MADGSELKRYLSLTFALAAREFPGSYRGNLTGALAAIAVPIAMLATYSLVFSRLIPVGGGFDRSGPDYVFFLFAGLIVWNLFSDVVIRAPALFRGAAHNIQRPRFPRSIIVLAPCLASLYRALPWLAVYWAGHLAMGRAADWPILLSLVVLGFAGILTLGISLWMAVLGVLVRDVSELTPPMVTLLFFLSPILYPSERLAALYPPLLWLNPLAGVIEAMRSVLLDQNVPAGPVVFQVCAACAVWLSTGLLLYRAVRRSLPDLV